MGDLNFHLEQQAYENLVSVQGLVNHVTFPTHERGGLLDPVLSDLPEANIRCQQLGKVGSSDHHAVLTHIHLNAAREDAVPRTTWVWDKADWPSLRQALHTTHRRCGGEDPSPHLNAACPPVSVCSSPHLPHQGHRPSLVWVSLSCFR